MYYTIQYTILYNSEAYIFSRCFNGENVPEEWKTNSEYKGICKYRGILVTITISRIYGRIINGLIQNEDKNHEKEEHCGFRIGRSCTDNVFCLKQVIIENKLEKNNNTSNVCMFVGLQKVYDNVTLNQLWEVLQ